MVLASPQGSGSDILGRYELQEIIGRGGMATVYRAVRQGPMGFGRTVALKLIREDVDDPEEAVTMFSHEAVMGGVLDHPNIVRVLDFGQEQGQWFIVMEYVSGINLRQAMGALGGPWPQKLAAHVALGVARALAHAHDARDRDGALLGLVHRDVTPKNILLSVHGEVKLGDFGIVDFMGRRRYTATGEIRGKLGYLAPEQTLGKSVDFRTDIYALGLVLWEMVAGRPRYDLDSSDVFTDLMMARYVSPSMHGVNVDPPLERILRRCLARDPDARWDSTRTLVAALEEYLQNYDGSREIARLTQGVQFGETGQDLGVDLPTRVNIGGDTLEFVQGLLVTGKTMVLEENIDTRAMEPSEIRAVIQRTQETGPVRFVSARTFFRGLVAGAASSMAVALVLAMVWWTGPGRLVFEPFETIDFVKKNEEIAQAFPSTDNRARTDRNSEIGAGAGDESQKGPSLEYRLHSEHRGPRASTRTGRGSHARQRKATTRRRGSQEQKRKPVPGWAYPSPPELKPFDYRKPVSLHQ